LSEPAVSYAFEQLEPSAPAPRDGPARLIAQAEAEAESIRAQAHTEGRAAGHADGLEEVSAAVRALQEALQGVASLRASVAESVERDAVELALTLAEKILAGALQARPELVLDVVQGALRRVSDRRGIAVLVNPADLDTLQAAIAAQSSEINQPGQANPIELLDLQPDQRVDRGGAIVRSAEGEIDAGVQTQLERAREVVCAALADDEPVA
jgi:flagellar assembly protein FliH